MSPGPGDLPGHVCGPRAQDPAATEAAQRVRALSTHLLGTPSLLLPLAAAIGDAEASFESTLRGPSMLPTIPSGVRIRFHLAGQHGCTPGDIAMFRSRGGYMMHRVVHRTGGVPAYLITCGDNHVVPDAPVRVDDVLGIAVAMQTEAGWRSLGRSFVCPLHRRVVRAATFTGVIAALWLSADAARRLAAGLLAFETRGRATVRFFRRSRQDERNRGL